MDIKAFQPLGQRADYQPNRVLFTKILRSLSEKIKESRLRSRNLQVLRELPDYLLGDIGLSRVDLERITTDSFLRDPTLIDRWKE